MCGIAGILANDVTPYRERLQEMLHAIRHRGPDAENVWLDSGKRVLLGHTRLSIQDLTAHGAQPMQSISGRFVITYNGEIYNTADLKAALPGHVFKGHSDTEVLLEHIARYGVAATLPKLVGMFAFAVVDLKEAKLYLVCDRLGIKPLYYTLIGTELAFASELNALRKSGILECKLNFEAAAMFTRHAYILAPETIFQDVKKLVPGTCLVYNINNQQIEACDPYWKLSEFTKRRDKFTSFEDAFEFYAPLIEDAVKIRLVSDVPLGCFLSGGYDSTCVAAMMQKVSSRPINTFSIGFEEQAYNEAPHAKRVAELLGTHHSELYVSEDEALRVVPEIPFMYDEPFADSSQIPTYLVSKMARQHVTVCLTGDGGDELFAGYNRYMWVKLLNRYHKKLPRAIKSLLTRFIFSMSKDTWEKCFYAARPITPSKFRFNLPGDKLYKLGHFLQKDTVSEQYYSFVSLVQDPSQLLRGRDDRSILEQLGEHHEGLSEIALMQYFDFITYLPGDILTKVDRASMACSLEARVPLLDHRLVENTWRLQDAHKVNGTAGKLILKKLVHQYVPEEMMNRPKMGFGIPVGLWLRSKLREYVENHLSESSLNRIGLYQVEPVRRMWQEHVSGRNNHEYALWGILMMQAWCDAHGIAA